jgi:hypothetical protein
MRRMNATRFKVGTKTRTRVPRTGQLKRNAHNLFGPVPVKQVNKFESWLMQPLHVGAGRFLRLARELNKKPARAQRQYLRLMARDKEVAAKLGLTKEGGS